MKIFSTKKCNGFTLISKKTRGFSLIELIVVIAVIGILVLLAMPKFMDYTKEAKMAQIKHDIKVAETIMDEYLSIESKLPDGLGLPDMDTPLAEGRLFETRGDATVIIGEAADYRDVTTMDNVQSIGSKLPGQFVADENGNIYYIHDKAINIGDNNGDSTDDVSVGYEIAADSDFVFTTYAFAPNYYGGQKGYYKYIGSNQYVEIPEMIQGNIVRDYYRMFQLNNSVIGVSTNSEHVTNTSETFAYSIVEELDQFNTGNVTNMKGMFLNSNALSLDVSGFDTSNVTNMESMFYGSVSDTIDVSGFNTSKVTSMASMFFSTNAASLDVSGFDTSKVSNMKTMFYRTNALSLDISGFNTSYVTSMENMFSEAKSETIDLSSFDTSNVTSMYGMFMLAKASSIDTSSLNTTKVTTMNRMFFGTNLASLDLNSFDTTQVTSMENMFSYSKIDVIDLTSFNLTRPVSFERMFMSAETSSIIFGPGFDTSQSGNYTRMFSMLSGVSELDLSGFTFDLETINADSEGLFGMFMGAATNTVLVKDTYSKDLLDSLDYLPTGLSISVKP